MLQSGWYPEEQAAIETTSQQTLELVTAFWIVASTSTIQFIILNYVDDALLRDKEMAECNLSNIRLLFLAGWHTGSCRSHLMISVINCLFILKLFHYNVSLRTFCLVKSFEGGSLVLLPFPSLCWNTFPCECFPQHKELRK